MAYQARLFIFSMLLLLTLSSFFSFKKKKEVAVEPPKPLPYPELMLASSGPVKHEFAAFGWLNTKGGPIDLKQVWVTHGVTTDQELFVESSNIAGLHIGRGAWIRNSVVRGESFVGEKRWSKLDAFNTAFHGPVDVNGPICADRCYFGDSIETKAPIVCLSHTIAQAIEIGASDNCNERQVVKLNSNTLVYGDIVFESENGIVVVDGSSYVNGSVLGGRVVSEPFPSIGEGDQSHP